MLKIQKYLPILTITLLNSCFHDGSDFYSFIDKEIHNSKNKDVINFRNFMGEKEWDYMYIFSESAEQKLVSKVTGIKYDRPKYGYRLILFTKNNQIIYELKETPTFDMHYPVEFYVNKIKFSRNNAKFIIVDRFHNIIVLENID